MARASRKAFRTRGMGTTGRLPSGHDDGIWATPSRLENMEIVPCDYKFGGVGHLF